MGSVRVRGLGKYYKHYSSSHGRLLEWLSLGSRRLHDQQWVLRDVDFAVGPGEALAVVGRNGAGKSTLLRLINGTLTASEGSVEVDGRMAALELGLRFNDDLSGLQNLYHSGQLLGLTRTQITQALPWIEAFSELRSHLGDLVRTYSSGMRLRLAFSIATAVRPDILLVDEALAVGDVRFQQRCLARIREFREQGTILILVSHDLNSIRSICSSAILLEEGVLLRRGDPGAVLDYYNALLARLDDEYDIEQHGVLGERAEARSGAGQVVIDTVELYAEKAASRTFRVASPVRIEVRGRAVESVVDFTVGVAIRDRLGSDVFGTNSHMLGQSESLRAGEGFVAEFELPANLRPGEYTVTAALHAGRVHLEGSYDWWDHALAFQVLPGPEPHFEGVAYLPTMLRITKTSADPSGQGAE
jgi:lipopolysaccharide transport system ATP-binding protein